MQLTAQKGEPMYNTMITVAVLLAGLLIACAVSESLTLYEEYCEWLTRKRRAKYRRNAYADVYRRRVQSGNRESLWKVVKK